MASSARNFVASETTWLTWLVKSRIVIITFVLGIELAVSAFTRNNIPQSAFQSIIVIWYTVAVFFLVLRPLWPETRLQPRIQILTDLAFVTAVIYVTGGIDTSFNFLYPVVIIVAAILLPRYWAYMTAALSFILFGGMLELSYFELIRSYSVTKPDLKTLQVIVLVNLGAYLAIAYLASTLTSKLRQVDVQLREQSGALQSLQALHENIVNSVTGGLITTDMEGRLTFINPAAERLLEREYSEAIGQSVESMLSDRVPEIGPSGARWEAHTVTPSGTRKVIGMTVSPLNVPETGAIGYVYSFNDLTHIRRLEREIRTRDRMAVVGRLAAGIAHEIRNPLSSIAASANMLCGSEALEEDDRKLLDVVKRESNRLNAIITDFLWYSRQKEYRFEKQDIVRLLEDTLLLLQNRPEFAAGDGSGIRIERDFAVPSLEVEVDGDRMKQVFWNICDNAVRAMPQGGVLSVSFRSQRDCCVISVADTGIGMTAQQVEKVFEPFQSQFRGGTGLGLALVYQIVQAHEGKIAVQSTPGQGTKFTMELQVARQPQVAMSSAALAKAATAGSVTGKAN